LDVTSDFAASDLITVSGLKFANFTAASGGSLQLNVYGSGPIANAADSRTITINNPSRGGGGSSIPIPTTKNLTSFGFSQGAGIINGTNITVNVPYGTDTTNLVAIFTSDGSSVKINGVAQVSGATPNNFTKPVVYTVMASDNSIQNYTVTVTVAQNSVDLSDIASILKEIQRLQELVANIESQSGQNASQPAGQQTNQFIFTKNLRLGNIDLEVKHLQQYLNASGFMVAQTGAGSPGKETQYFGQRTKQALIKFQEKYADEILTPLGFTKGTGIVGAYTRKKLNGF